MLLLAHEGGPERVRRGEVGAGRPAYDGLGHRHVQVLPPTLPDTASSAKALPSVESNFGKKKKHSVKFEPKKPEKIASHVIFHAVSG
jgi:hypothetical protein